MTHEEAITELVRIWHSPHLDLSLKAGLAEVIDTLKESNLNDSLVRGEVDVCKESESKLDLISRQDAMMTVIRMCSPICDWELEKKAYTDCVIDEINSLPSAEARPTGEWVQKDMCADRFCSECNYAVWDSEAEEYNFCPNCGAKMYKGGDTE